MRKINYAVFAIILVFVSSCKLLDNESPTPVLSLITVDEARLWYERQNSSGARVATKKTEELAYWKYAQQGKLTNGVEIISVPLLYNNYHQVSVLSDENFVKQGDNYVLGNFDRAAYQIQRKLLISKDEKGNYRSVIITIIPDRKEQRKKEAVTRNKFSGTVLLMNKTDDGFKIGWRYKNGKFLDVFYPQPQSPSGRLGTYNCKVGFYKLMAVSGGGGGYNCTPGNDRACLPSSYIDQATGGFWVLTGTFDATCDDGLPAGIPVRKNPWDDESSWVAADPNGGGGGGTPVIRDPFDPVSPTPIDYGMPIDLDPVDAFAWEMANRITNKVFLTGEEIEIVRMEWNVTYAIRRYVDEHGQKPSITMTPPPPGRTIKIVGQDSFDENVDFRLYQNKCDALNYLKIKAQTSSTEVGAYVTNAGIVVGPNNEGGANTYSFWVGIPVFYVNGVKVSSYQQVKLTTSNMGDLNIGGYIHTHPANYSIEPSSFDRDFASKYQYPQHYIIGTRSDQLVISQFNDNGSVNVTNFSSSTPFSGCP